MINCITNTPFPLPWIKETFIWENGEKTAILLPLHLLLFGGLFSFLSFFYCVHSNFRKKQTELYRFCPLKLKKKVYFHKKNVGLLLFLHEEKLVFLEISRFKIEY